MDAGVFSVVKKSTERAEDATRLWNPSCYDTMSFDGGYSDLIRGALSDVANAELWERSPNACGGAPPDHAGCASDWSPMCDEATDACVHPYCSTFAPFCGLVSTLGIRARQMCPLTCGCDDPKSALALFLPESGCGDQCMRAGTYLERRRALPCEDAAVDDATFQAVVADILTVATEWPLDWETSALFYYSAVAKNGCAYLGADWLSLRYPEDYAYPPYVFAINPCTGGGTYHPVKPLSYFCPVACGCRSGDAHCPDACPARNGTETCEEHQKMANGGACPMTAGRSVA